ncbi:citrate synthase [Stella humosa]|uniref:citrate synthase (unknown stereospecificity) n=1 Tax=Stella humosa TaxID=94 RepID=A0A3N1M9Q4_9PROT|nr:citrate/2-methylcitrate synthase [Stella humosa]ROQ00401.1 citrate synthase [Stella humosa]
MNGPTLLDAAEATRRLGVRHATLYAYVSRGQIRAEPHPTDPRRSLYAAEDVDRMAAGRALGRSPGRAAAATLDWGLPVLDSAITQIEHGRLFYRGRDAVRLAETASLEDAARLLWDCGAADPFDEPVAEASHVAANPPPLDLFARCMAGLSADGLAQSETWARDPQRRWQGAALLLRHAAAVAIGRPPSALPTAQAMAAAWGAGDAATDLIRRALVLGADHELNASTFATRVIASTGAALAAAVVGGMAALSGPRHGGMTLRVQALLDEIAGHARPAEAVALRLRRGDRLPGFGHPLYPAGDPRATALLDRLDLDPALRDTIAAAADLTGEAPNIDFALVALARVHRLPADAPAALFLVGRTVGWIAHALEQHATGGLIRPRARYIGVPSSRGSAGAG